MAVLGLSCGLQDLPSLLQHAPSSSCNMWDPLPWWGTELRPLHWEDRALATGPLGKSVPRRSFPRFLTTGGLLRFLITFRMSFSISSKKHLEGTSLVVQWLRICVPMQGTWVLSLVKKDYMCHGATKPVCHNCWACILERWADTAEPARPGAAATREATATRSQRTATRGASTRYNQRVYQQRRPSAAEINQLIKKTSLAFW